MTAIDVVLWMLVFTPALPFLATLILMRHWRIQSMSLRERAVIAVRDWVSASIIAILALRLQLDWQWPQGLSTVLLLCVVVLYSIPSAYWLYLYWRGAFR